MKCITLTLNPAFDHHCKVPGFSLYHEHLVAEELFEAGGKGVNISRALSANGVENIALVVLGEENQAAFRAALDADGLHYSALTLPGRVRENLTIHSENAGETRVSFAGFSATDALLDDVIKCLKPELEERTVVTFTGRAPKGVGMPAIMRFLNTLSQKGCRIVIDSRSFVSLDEIVAAKPWLIKPNQEEISEYLGRDIQSLEETLTAAKDIHARGVENVMISLGGDGALLVCDAGCFICKAPVIDFHSAIGAGDSSIGGFIAATLEGQSADAALCRAVAYGSAACMQEGTRPPRPADVEALLSKIAVKKLG